jgi:two-component system, chemotaxis family, CheB/CheR fusion protein
LDQRIASGTTTDHNEKQAAQDAPRETDPVCVVGVGVSAGGLEALERLFHRMPPDTGAAFVVIQHLSPDFKSLMKELMDRFTQLETVAVHGRTKLKANTIYLLTPRRNMFIEGNEVYTVERESDQKHSLPINLFFRSLAAEWGDRSVAIVLSGTGSDGSAGVVEMREAGALVLVQNEASAGFDGMPRSAIDTGCVDAILKPEDMPERILAFASHTQSASGHGWPQFDGTGKVPDGLPTILKALRTAFDIDFNYYKPSTITRRIERRVAMHPDKPTLAEYGRRVQRNRQELSALYKDLLIGVTRFFRDPEAFEAVKRKALDNLLGKLSPSEELRIWVCACSTGEEAYTVAILVMEAMAKRGMPNRVKILATDIHDESLRIAAEGFYKDSALAEMPEDMRSRYFVAQPNGGWRVTADLRRAIIFSEHNVLRDPPFTRMDLVSCRNLLIYFESAAQLRAIAAFHFALNLEGYLLLGGSEGLGELAAEFETADRTQKLFRKIRENRSLNEFRLPLRQEPGSPQRRTTFPSDMRLGRSYEVLLSQLVPSGVLINERHEALHVFGDASQYLSAPRGKVSSDVMSMTSGNLRTALMAALRSARNQGKPVLYGSVQWSESPDSDMLDISVDPVEDTVNSSTFYLIRFITKSRRHTVLSADQVPEPMQGPLEPLTATGGTEHVELLETELQHARESLQSTVEELETSNEELQAANEELLASNEELQSTNEELHSVNEELYSVNAEHELKFHELTIATSDLQNLVRSTELATLFIDSDYVIRLFSPNITDMFSLLPQDVGRDLRHFKPNETDEKLFDDLALGVAGKPVPERTLPGRTGATLLRRVTPYVDTNNKRSGLVLTYVDVTEIRNLNEALEQSRAQLEALFRTSPTGLLLVDAGGAIQMCNPTLERMFGYPVGSLKGAPIDKLVPGNFRQAHHSNRLAYSKGPSHRAMGSNSALYGLRRDGTTFPIEVQLAPVEDNEKAMVQATVIDATEGRKHERELRLHRDRLETMVNQRTEELTQANNRLREVLARAESASLAKGRFLANMSHEIRTPLNGILGLVDLIRQEAKLEPEHQEMVQRISKAGRQLMSVINDILDVSRVEAGKLTLDLIPFLPTDLIQNAISMVGESAKAKGLSLKVTLDEAVPGTLEGDINRLGQILINLLSNAIKFTEQGQVTLKVTTEKVVAQKGEKRSHLRFEVQDTGPGISAIDRERIFSSFEQVDDSAQRKHKGTGLGLAIVRHLTTLMKGRCGVDSQPGQGSCFWVSVPMNAIADSLAIVPGAPAETAQLLRERHAGARVLIVEDEPLNQEVTEGMLKGTGLEILTADNGQAALKVLRKKSVNLVLMDIQMPGMDGLDCAKAIRTGRGRKTLPIIGVTANAFPEDQDRCAVAGMNDFLAKPFEQEQLLSKVLLWLDKRPGRGSRNPKVKSRQ